MSALAPAFADPVLEAQAVFRAVMDAMARPGTVKSISGDLDPPRPLARTAASVALALLDHETPFWLDAPLADAADVSGWIRFHTGAPYVTQPDEAAFAILADSVQAPPFDRFALGSMEYPDRSATLILQVESFSGAPMRLTGPGIAGSRSFAASPLPGAFFAQMGANRALFPRGVDLIFVTNDSLAALPRSTRVEAES
jgi:alpha-D-ribose 1-methylphosphonate 5-triphosphate synthase subunit PhnH